MEKFIKELKENKIVIIVILLTVIVSLLFNNYLKKDYSRVNNDTTDFVSGKVVEVTSSEVEYDEELKINLGKQVVKVEILEGKNKGKTVSMDNYLTAAHNIEVKVGTKVIISADEPDGIDAYYTVYNFDRSLGMVVFTLVLFMAIITIGKGKGIKSIIGLAYTLYLVIFFLLPTVFSGYSPVIMSVICVILSTIVTLMLLNGRSEKTYGAIISTVLGVVLSAGCFYLMSIILNINGFSSDEAESLVLITRATNLQIKEILFAGILISSLGAIMDVGMSIVSSLYEVYHHQPNLTRKELFNSGIEIGKDMIGTMTNTLILAFTGSAFISLLVLFSYNVDTLQLLNSNYIVIEFAQGVAGTLGIVLTVPIASSIATIILIKNNEDEELLID
ncbi:YibE/F family protein [Thomasclavelia saccharogumia]|uniref:YibE/F family protein n=1 Tax=Thomasclavelia saccharogumia TaxID=341225 RepID=UPI00047B9F1E|nr:YibE/F family protein [Thomasclavelia saccharogumia]